MKNRNTIQKQIIIDCLKNTKTHPTAHELYELVQQKNSNIGQATIYRTLKSMVKSNNVLVISSENGINHYDGNTLPHSHLICNICEKISDIFYNDNVDTEDIESKYCCKINNKFVIYNGICKNCLEKYNK